MNQLKTDLINDEGMRTHPYKCTAGKLTIGVGRNLEDRGITEEEALYLLNNDIELCRKQCEANIFFFHQLNEVRRNVLINMCFNIGIAGLMKFKKALTAMSYGDFDTAAREMLKSRWADQVGRRAKRLAAEMRSGEK